MTKHTGTPTPASPPILLPTSINWVAFSGVHLIYDGKTADELVASGLVEPDEIPRNRNKKSRDGKLGIYGTRDGRFNVMVCADSVMSRDGKFKQFLGWLLADTRLSLVRGEATK